VDPGKACSDTHLRATVGDSISPTVSQPKDATVVSESCLCSVCGASSPITDFLHSWQFVSPFNVIAHCNQQMEARRARGPEDFKHCASGLKGRASGDVLLGIDTWILVLINESGKNYLLKAGSLQKAIVSTSTGIAIRIPVSLIPTTTSQIHRSSPFRPSWTKRSPSSPYTWTPPAKASAAPPSPTTPPSPPPSQTSTPCTAPSSPSPTPPLPLPYPPTPSAVPRSRRCASRPTPP